MTPHATAHSSDQVAQFQSMKEQDIETLDDLIRKRASEQIQIPLIALPRTDSSVIDFDQYTAKDLHRLTDQATGYYVSQDINPVEKEAVIAQLGPTDLAYIITFFALSRLGYTILCLSPRLAPKACLELCKICGATAMIVGDAPQMKHLATTMQDEASMRVLAPVTRDWLMRTYSHEPLCSYRSMHKKNKNQICMILHSSGTTGLPKPVYIPQSRVIMNIPPPPGRIEFSTFPFHHAYGNQVILRNIKDRKTTYINDSRLPLTAGYITKVIKTTHPDVLHVVPYILELLALAHEGLDALKQCKRIVFAGGSFSDDLGHKLVEQGVNLETMWGMTEAGTLGTSCNRPRNDKAWDYIRISESYKDHVWMAPVEDNVHECVFLSSLPSLTATNSDSPPGSFRSKDLFQKHHAIPNAWKHVGRLDDRLALANGEKVLPVPMEQRIRQHELVKEAVVFGIDRHIPGLLVFRNDSARGMSNEDYIEAIWSAIENANSNAESFAHLSKETVVPVAEDVRYAMTDKRSIKRRQIYDDFKQEIDAMYERLDTLATGTLQLDIPSLEDWLLVTFRQRLGIRLSTVTDDFFDSGLSSLQAIHMRGLILRHLDLGSGDQIPDRNVVYHTGLAFVTVVDGSLNSALGRGKAYLCKGPAAQTIVYFLDVDSGIADLTLMNVARLAKALYALRTGKEESHSKESDLDSMANMIAAYSSFTKHRPGTSFPKKDTVILTGATGSLGAHLLNQLMRLSNVEHVYCLVRGADPNHRVCSALEERQLECPTPSKFTALTCDLSLRTLGLSSEIYDHLCSQATVIFHCAWTVNFNLGLASFETQHIQGVRNLIQCSLSTPHSKPARFYFCSSIAAALATPSPAVIGERQIDNLSDALPQGYGRSKLVAEHITMNAMHNFGAFTRIFRIGQVVGDKVTGSWSDHEAVPMILRSAISLKALPALDEIQSWLPVDSLAKTLVDLADLRPMLNIDNDAITGQWDQELVYNIQNPNTFHWTQHLLPELATLGLDFSVVSPTIWLNKLRNYTGDVAANPAVKLIGHYENQYGDNARNGNSRLTFSLDGAIGSSESLKSAPRPIQDGYVRKFVEVWRSKWDN